MAADRDNPGPRRKKPALRPRWRNSRSKAIRLDSWRKSAVGEIRPNPEQKLFADCSGLCRRMSRTGNGRAFWASGHFCASAAGRQITKNYSARWQNITFIVGAIGRSPCLRRPAASAGSDLGVFQISLVLELGQEPAYGGAPRLEPSLGATAGAISRRCYRGAFELTRPTRRAGG